jgi:hypothetical protein
MVGDGTDGAVRVVLQVVVMVDAAEKDGEKKKKGQAERKQELPSPVSGQGCRRMLGEVECMTR